MTQSQPSGTLASAPGLVVPGGFGLYVHWPFCLHKCPYCDFNSHVAARPVDQARWRRALLAELDYVGAETRGRRLDTIFFGGGTPSLMASETVAALCDRAAHWWHLADDLEITLEANPTSVEAGKLREFRSAGINRISLGIQALDDRALRFLGRTHTAREALDALTLAASTFDRRSFDLIYGRPGQTLEAWTGELEQAAPYFGGHVSAYQLTIEPGTRFHAMAEAGALQMPDDDQLADFFDLTRAFLEGHGLKVYEISNHARPGDACRHNLVYWRYGDYVGIGPGAHGRLTLGSSRFATTTLRAPGAWLEAVEQRGHAEQPREPLDLADQAAEMTLMGLRLEEGVDLARLADLLGRPAEDLLRTAASGALIEDGWLKAVNGRLKTTEAGLRRLNSVTGRLIDGLPAPRPDQCLNRPQTQWISSAPPHAA